jgi:sn-glycerol 3-phosphate transport system substrate-binding protein
MRYMMGTQQTIRWATQTGYMPVTTDAIAELERVGYYKQNPNDRVAIDQLRVATPWPWLEDLFRLQREVVQPRVEEAVFNGASASILMAAARKLAVERR